MEARICDQCRKVLEIQQFDRNYEERGWFKIIWDIAGTTDICSAECGIEYLKGVISRIKQLS
jgi:hypothetical protein